jgi:hypothetical protein
MVLAGVPLPVVEAHLGHESINTTISLCTHLDRRSGEVAAEAIAVGLAGPLVLVGRRSQGSAGAVWRHPTLH